MNIASHFHASATRFPEQVAIVWEGGEIRYGQLLRLVQSLRAALPSTPRIGLFAHRDPAAFAAVQAILSVGAAYVPFKPSSPAKHNRRIQQLSEVSTIIVGADCEGPLSGFLDLHEGPLSIVAFEPSEALRSVVDRHPGVALREARLESEPSVFAPAEPLDGSAYILFTSGSTGTPKGVVGTHAAVEEYLAAFLGEHAIFAHDRLAQVSDFTFDPTIHDMFVAWSAGAALVVIPDRERSNPIEFSRQSEVTVWNSLAGLPALLETFGPIQENALPKVRLSLFGGEKLTWNAIQVWKKVAPKSVLLNMYGLTETTIAIAHFEIPADFPLDGCHHGIVPIGKPFPGQTAEILRADGTPCDPLEEGTLWLAGTLLAAGYLDPALTTERFVEREGRLWYRTGDLAFFTETGDIQFLGREDTQVKVNGYRVELGEIEAALRLETGASFAVAEVARLRGDMDEIVCVLPTSCEARKKAIREALRDVLEPHKMPRIWKFEDDLPLNANGKIDRKALKASWESLPG
jgi:amino acid adenylation domain-containing protein